MIIYITYSYSIYDKINYYFDDLPFFEDKKENNLSTSYQSNFGNFGQIMLQKDKIKVIVVLILISIMAITYFLVGKESVIMKSVAGGSLVIWVLTLLYVNKKYK